jgi:alkanesulfonate monooxygenase SsuD/methylene tetrahydromethanopterin reductase-like flavin-dependent oxidoreductase (luciferase family)
VDYGAHLPLIDFWDRGWRPDSLSSYVDAARDSGFSAVAANDHFLFARPWLDGIVALASVIECSGSMDLVTTVALPVVRGTVALAKAAAALDILSGGRLTLGVGPGSSARDYEAVGLPFEERWPRFDAALQALRDHLREDRGGDGPQLEPKPPRAEGPAIWVGSWGSSAGLRRAARLADGWLASAYNTTPGQLAEARSALAAALRAEGRAAEGFPCGVSTMWTYVTGDSSRQEQMLSHLSDVINRPADALREQLLVGPAEECARRLSDYARAGVDRVFIWPLRDEATQVEAFMSDVAPLVKT